jgi:hypothetical protein
MIEIHGGVYVRTYVFCIVLYCIVCMYVCMYVLHVLYVLHVCKYICMYVCMYASVYACMYNMYVCEYVYVQCVCMYVCIHISVYRSCCITHAIFIVFCLNYKHKTQCIHICKILQLQLQQKERCVCLNASDTLVCVPFTAKPLFALSIHITS